MDEKLNYRVNFKRVGGSNSTITHGRRFRINVASSSTYFRYIRPPRSCMREGRLRVPRFGRRPRSERNKLTGDRVCGHRFCGPTCRLECTPSLRRVCLEHTLKIGARCPHSHFRKHSARKRARRSLNPVAEILVVENPRHYRAYLDFLREVRLARYEGRAAAPESLRLALHLLEPLPPAPEVFRP